MQYATLALAFAAAASAAPTYPKQGEFHVAFSVSGDNSKPNYVSANVASLDNSKPGHFILKGERLSVYPGTPASLSGGTVNKDLVFDFTKVFGSGNGTAIAPRIGSTAGAVQPIEVIENSSEHDLEWGVLSSGEIYHLKAQEGNQFFSCDVKIGNETPAVLSWGNPTADGKAPEGCKFTKVIKNGNA